MSLREHAEYYRGRAAECRRLRDAIAADEPMSRPERDGYVTELDRDIALWEQLAGELEEYTENNDVDEDSGPGLFLVVG